MHPRAVNKKKSRHNQNQAGEFRSAFQNRRTRREGFWDNKKRKKKKKNPATGTRPSISPEPRSENPAEKKK
jgi:hypothetical protein